MVAARPGVRQATIAAEFTASLVLYRVGYSRLKIRGPQSSSK